MSDLLLMASGPLLLIHLCFFLAVLKKNFSLIDVIWSLGFISISLTGCLLNQFSNWRENLIFFLVLLWGLRLSGFLFMRNAGKPEDYRYASMRKDWGGNANSSAYFKIFWLQYSLMLFISLPLIVAHFYPAREVMLLDYLGFILWSLGFTWEAIADYQKNKFKQIPGNLQKICQIGLWQYSRHPNYFGEATLWWGKFFITASTGNFWGLLGVTLLNFLLLKVSGVPLIEKRHDANPEYQQYKKDTPTLIPSIANILKSLRK